MRDSEDPVAETIGSKVVLTLPGMEPWEAHWDDAEMTHESTSRSVSTKARPMDFESTSCTLPEPQQRYNTCNSPCFPECIGAAREGIITCLGSQASELTMRTQSADVWEMLKLDSSWDCKTTGLF